MKRKPWLFAIALIALAVLAAALLLRPPAPHPPVSASPTPTVSPSPTALLPTPDWSRLPTVTPPGPGEPTLPPEALAMRAAPTATPGPMPISLLSPTPTPTKTPFPTPIPLISAATDNVPMVEIPAGEFIMGLSLQQARNFRRQAEQQYSRFFIPSFHNTVPSMTVYLETFWIDWVEVTNARYRRCVEAGVCREPLWFSPLPADYFTHPAYNHYPAIPPSWYDAHAYCQWVGKRLPTEAEWEKAARGSDGRLYPWGNEYDPTKLAMRPEPVGSHPEGASPYGVLDMAGNAGEWTSDRYRPYPGSVWGVEDNLFVWRGSVQGPTLVELAAYRETCRPDGTCGNGAGGIGFRCVRGGQPIPLAEAVVTYEQLVPQPPPSQEPDLSDMVYVPAGEFLMGAPEELLRQDTGHQHQDEGPQHVVYLDAFYIDRYEVTQGEYVEFLNALGNHYIGCGGHQCASVNEEMQLVSSGNEITRLPDGRYVVEEGYEDRPMVSVTWYGAQMYCAWRGKRLPTEAEWEKAARGTDGRRYPWGDIEGGADISPYGAVSMLGGVEEWVADWYHANYYAVSPARNPQGPDFGSDRVLRGGVSTQWGLTVRGRTNPSYYWAGFRCVYRLIETGQGVHP